jgi:hypothetical protein
MDNMLRLPSKHLLKMLHCPWFGTRHPFTHTIYRTHKPKEWLERGPLKCLSGVVAQNIKILFRRCIFHVTWESNITCHQNENYIFKLLSQTLIHTPVQKFLLYQVTLIDTNRTKPNLILPDQKHHRRHIHYQAKYHISDLCHKHITYNLTHHFECTTNHSDFYPVAVP